jgi:CheY-like chemotaxis protein
MVSRAELNDDLKTSPGGSTGIADQEPGTAHPAQRLREPYRILFVDDVEVYRELGRVILTRLGHRVTLAAQGEDAVKEVLRQEFDFVFMDVRMPVLDGYAATARIRELEKSTGRRLHIIAITAKTRQDERSKCLAAGMDDYINKPVLREEMVAALSRQAGQQADANRGDPAAGPPPPVAAAPAAAGAAGAAGAAAASGASGAAGADCSLPVFDRAGLLERLAGEEELIEQLLQGYLASVASHLDQLSAALFASDVQKVLLRAHVIKGASVNIGALQVNQAASQLEILARAGRLDGAVGIFDTLVSSFVRFRCLVEPESSD